MQHFAGGEWRRTTVQCSALQTRLTGLCWKTKEICELLGFRALLFCAATWRLGAWTWCRTPWITALLTSARARPRRATTTSTRTAKDRPHLPIIKVVTPNRCRWCLHSCLYRRQGPQTPPQRNPVHTTRPNRTPRRTRRRCLRPQKVSEEHILVLVVVALLGLARADVNSAVIHGVRHQAHAPSLQVAVLKRTRSGRYSSTLGTCVLPLVPNV